MTSQGKNHPMPRIIQAYQMLRKISLCLEQSLASSCLEVSVPGWAGLTSSRMSCDDRLHLPVPRPGSILYELSQIRCFQIEKYISLCIPGMAVLSGTTPQRIPRVFFYISQVLKVNRENNTRATKGRSKVIR